MWKEYQKFFGFIFVLFFIPFLVVVFPSAPNQVINAEPQEENLVVYAANLYDLDVSNEEPESKKALMYFTHSHEAFQPIVRTNENLTAVYHPNSNIMMFEDEIKNHFSLNDIQTDFLAVDTMGVIEKNNRVFYEAYDIVRPFVATQIKGNTYDLIIDLHRDSAIKEITTLTYNNQTYGKLYFVVGEDNPNYHVNKDYAERISAQLNSLVPGISRGIVGKKGEHADGVYNQDLADNMVLIELGGIDNTQEEINRTISVLAKAISNTLHEQTK